MLHTTNTLNIDGTVFKNEDIKRMLLLNNNDAFSRWVVRPLAILTAVGLLVAGFFVSAFFVSILLAMLPLLILSIWALRKKIERDLSAADPVVDTQNPNHVDSAPADVQITT